MHQVRSAPTNKDMLVKDPNRHMTPTATPPSIGPPLILMAVPPLAGPVSGSIDPRTMELRK